MLMLSPTYRSIHKKLILITLIFSFFLVRVEHVILNEQVSLSQGWAKRQKQLKQDPLALARRLLQDGEAQRALLALKELDLTVEGFDRRGYERLMGLITYQLKTYHASADHFKQAIALGDQDPSLFFFYARTLAELKQELKALEILAQAPKSLWSNEVVWRLKLQLIYQAQGAAQAYPLLNQMITQFPQQQDLKEQRLRLLCELGLFQTALALVVAELEKPKSSVEQLLSYARILSETGHEDQASLLLEKGLLIFETEDQFQAQLRQMLAHSYLKQSRAFSAAELLFPLSLTEPKYALYTAELYRKAGQINRALWVNRLIVDQKSKLKQRLTLLIEEERYEEAAALLDRIDRLGLLKNESITYALAYSFYRIYEFEKSIQLLAHLESDQMYEKGIQLRRAIDQCQLDAWRCE